MNFQTRKEKIAVLEEENQALQKKIVELERKFAINTLASYKSLSSLEQDLVNTQKKLANCRELISIIENTKFWQLRQHWLKVKTKLGIDRQKSINSYKLRQQCQFQFLFSQEDFIRLCYSSILGREADDKGLEDWLKYINKNPNPINLIKKFIQSDEFLSKIGYQLKVKRIFDKFNEPRLLIARDYFQKKLEIQKFSHKKNKKELDELSWFYIFNPAYNQAYHSKIQKEKIVVLEEENQALKKRIVELEKRLAINSLASHKPLSSLEQDLVNTQKKLANCRELISIMENTKFWQLRQHWLKVKTKLGIDRQKSINLYKLRQQCQFQFLFSQEDFIRLCYSSILGREADDKGLEDWLKYFNKNPNPINLIKSFIQSDEFLLKMSYQLKVKKIFGKFNEHRLLITPQYPPKKIEIPNFYYKKNKENLDNLPWISIVTPSFNQAHFIEDTIKSVLQQDYSKLEYIIQDGNSQDNTSKIVKKYSNYLQFNSEPDRGQSNAINKGFANTTGEIMAWLNSDDLLLPGTLFYVAEYFNHHPEVDVIYGHRIIINEHNQEIGRWVLPAHDNHMLQWADYVPQETMFWRRKLWEQVGGYVDESFKFAIDWDLILRFHKINAIFRRLPRFLGAFRVYKQQKTQSSITVGEKEMNILRRQCHGYIPSPLEINKNINRYINRSSFHYQLHSFNKAIWRNVW